MCVCVCRGGGGGMRVIVFSAILNPDLNPIWAYIRASPVGMPNEKCKDYLALGATNHPAFGLVRAITSIDVKLCKMEKGAHFTQFEQKNTHISGCKLV